jgi:putative heme-binding domain-containing protein
VFVSVMVRVSELAGAPVDDHARRPIAVWPAGPIEVVAAFGQPIERALAEALVGQVIPYVEGSPSLLEIKPNDRLSGQLRIAAIRLADENRTLVIATDPHPRIARYSLPLPAGEHGRRPGAKGDSPAVYDLRGVEVTWTEEGGDDARPVQTAWWPRLDAELARNLTRGSRPHDQFFDQLRKRGRLVLSTLVRLPKGAVTLRLDCNQTIDEAALGESQGEATLAGGGPTHAMAMKCVSQGEPLFLTATVRTGEDNRPLALRVTYRPLVEKADRPLEAAELLVPWAPLATDGATQSPVLVPNLAGGDPVRGRGLFTGEQARCSQCHLFRGQGEQVGPDLTEIARKSRAEIYRSIAAPSAEIEPAYATYTVITKTGQVVAGMARAEGADAIRVTDTNAHATLIPRRDIEQIRPSGTSIMPVGLTATLGESAIRDIISYLTSPAAGTASK